MGKRKKKKKSYSQVIRKTSGLVGYWPLNEWWTMQDWILVDDKWHHLAVVMPSNKIPEIYIDGEHPQRASLLSVHNKVLKDKEIRMTYKKGL